MNEPPYQPPSTKEALLARYAQGERYFGAIALPPSTDLSGVDLRYAVFDGGRLNAINFQHAHLQHVRFRAAQVTGTDFRYSALRHATFTDATIDAISLYGADLTGVTFMQASYYGIDLTEANEQDILAECIDRGTPFPIALLRARNQERLARHPLWRRYPQSYEGLLALLFQHDPIGICLEANPKKETEYLTEVDLLLPHLNTAPSPTALHTLVYQTFVRCFGATAQDAAHYDALAFDIWTWGMHPDIQSQLRMIDPIRDTVE